MAALRSSADAQWPGCWAYLADTLWRIFACDGHSRYGVSHGLYFWLGGPASEEASSTWWSVSPSVYLH